MVSQVPSLVVNGIRKLKVPSAENIQRPLVVASSMVLSSGVAGGVADGSGRHLPRRGSVDEGAGPSRVKVLSGAPATLKWSLVPSTRNSTGIGGAFFVPAG